MSAIENPALRAFVAAIRDDLVFAQVLVRRAEAAWEIRHADDAAASASSLRELHLTDVRPLAQFSADGKFRPLKSAPTLMRGWRFVAPSDELLYEALNRIYPGAVADWFAAQQVQPPVTHYREFAARQSGMYRITAMLPDAPVAEVINACCAPGNCLKRRLWTVPGFAVDAPQAKSLIPCLEPCAIALETARKTARAFLDQDAAASSSSATDTEQ